VSGVRIGCIVEGHGDSEAVPVLIRRIAEGFDPALYVHVPSPIRIPKSRLVRPGELERAVELAALKIPGQGGILVLLDSGDDCPAHRGPSYFSAPSRRAPTCSLALYSPSVNSRAGSSLQPSRFAVSEG
jgi:hypothetical protein